MAFGFPWAYYKEKIETDGDKESARKAVLRTFEALGWKPEAKGPDKYRVYLREPDGRSYSEYVTVTLLDKGAFIIKSRCVYVQAIDFGKNKENVEEFKSRFANRK
jgi:hypothetical protein